MVGSGEHSITRLVNLLRPSHNTIFYWVKLLSKASVRQAAGSSCFYALQPNDEVIIPWAILGIHFLKKKKKKPHSWLTPFLKGSLYHLHPPDTRNQKRNCQEFQSSTLSSSNILWFQSNYHCALPISYAMFISGLPRTLKCLGNQLRR